MDRLARTMLKLASQDPEVLDLVTHDSDGWHIGNSFFAQPSLLLLCQSLIVRED